VWGDAVHLAGPPLLGVRLERDTPSARIHVFASVHARRDLIQPTLRVGLAGEMFSVFLACLVAVACPPLARANAVNISRLIKICLVGRDVKVSPDQIGLQRVRLGKGEVP
jgi:hypothetical protein